MRTSAQSERSKLAAALSVETFVLPDQNQESLSSDLGGFVRACVCMCVQGSTRFFPTDVAQVRRLKAATNTLL